MFNPITPLRNSNIWSRLPINYKGAIIIAIPAICLLATLGAWIGSRQLGQASLARIEHTETVIEKSNQLLLSLLNAETGVRGYYISRKDEFLAPYRYANSTLPQTLLELDRLLQSNSLQMARWREIDELVRQEMELLDRKVASIQQQPAGISTEQERRLIEQGNTVMNAIRRAVEQLQSEEQLLRTQEQERLANLRQIITVIQWSSAWVSAIAYWFAVYLFNRLDRELGERELQLRESKTFIETITNNIIDAVIAIDRDNRIVTFNPAASEMFGYCPHEAIGQDLTLLLIEPGLPDSEKAEKVNFWHNNLLQEEHRWQTTGYSKNTDIFPIEISLSEMEPDDQRMVIIRDVSESEAAKAKLKARADELARLSSILAKANTDLDKQIQELDRFAYVASHDLKAPLRAIASLSEWIEEDLDEHLTGETRHQMNLLRGRVHRLEALINGLLTYSRIGRVKSEVEIVNVRQLLDEIIDSLAPPNGFTIEIASEMPTLLTHKVPLRQVFANLIGNAIGHHHCPVGKITILAEELEGFYRFAVTDDGPGIPPEFHQKIFVIFQTLYARDIKENTGIGLAIVKKILDNLGGIIDLESRPDSGSTFSFTWPK
jgi:PAS domain S-box-containing protein